MLDRIGARKGDRAPFTILLYHRPEGVEDAARSGIDLMLCGHTHNGQIVPFDRIVKRYFPRIAGRFDIDGMVLYVSPGTGTWGPTMRLGSSNEITMFELSPGAGRRGTRIMILRVSGTPLEGHFSGSGIEDGVDPISWTPGPLGRRYPLCRNRNRPPVCTKPAPAGSKPGGRLYVPTLAGFLSLAIVLDVFSRRVVGWAMAGHLRTELVLDALDMAVEQRRPDSVIHH